ncbi:MAG: FAD-dependent oxidoreductase, partial [Burkholderiaceae bacterium]
PRLYRGEHAFLLQNPDGRVVFTIPYEQRYTLIGTTDVSFEGDPAGATISQGEIRYLCESVNAYFDRRIAVEDITWTYAGVRSLSDDEAENASMVTRDYKLELAQTSGEAVLLSVFGGKITTYRRLAEMALDKLQPFVGGTGRDWTDRAPLPGGDFAQGNFTAFLNGVRQRWPFLADDLAERLARAYGSRIEKVLAGAQRMDDLGKHYGAGLTRAEVDYLQANEWAVTAEDILWRRTKLALHMSDDERQRLASAIALGSPLCV